MKKAFRALDGILRGEATRPQLLQEGTFDLPVPGLALVITALAMLYGACMGVSSLIGRWSTPTRYLGYEQIMASMAKVPMLFFLTLLITFPSLYVFNALVGSRLTIGALLRLLIAAMSVMLAVLASFGTIVGFFAVSTTSYPFMKLLNVIVFTIAGFMGLAFLLRTLQRLSWAHLEPYIALPLIGATPEGGEPATTPPTPAATGAPDRISDRRSGANVYTIFKIWVIVFGLVGAQMGWVLRPFIGDPDMPFSFFRPRTSNFFEQILHTLSNLLGGGGWGGRG